MQTIINNTARDYHLPMRKHPETGEEFGGTGTRVCVLPGNGTIDVPDWYVDALRAESKRDGTPTGWALRLARGLEVNGPRLGANADGIAAAAQRVREAREIAQAADARRREAELAAREAETMAASKAREADVERQRSAMLEQRIRELEAQTATPKTDPDPKKKGSEKG